MMGYSGCPGLGFFGGMGGGMWTYGIAILLIILAVVYFVNRGNHHKNTALETLDQEYAKGNVSDDDYRKRKDNLNS
ncbi:hypothetical protein [Companilactobacillus halodurans]|nr:hypothetical protein [Companilactobacillus halodurans]